MELNNSYQKVAWLLSKVPAAQFNYKLLILLYWQLFDNVAIPKKVIDEIAKKGTEPETISRSKRKVMENNINIKLLKKQLKEVMMNEQRNNKSKNR